MERRCNSLLERASIIKQHSKFPPHKNSIPMNPNYNNTLIQTQELVKRFGEKIAVDRVTFEVSAGEVFGFLGPNGAGKTTTIKMIVGLLQPTSGSVSVAGFDLEELTFGCDGDDFGGKEIVALASPA